MAKLYHIVWGASYLITMILQHGKKKSKEKKNEGRDYN